MLYVSDRRPKRFARGRKGINFLGLGNLALEKAWFPRFRKSGALQRVKILGLGSLSLEKT
jgi:hypothetical protein